MHVFVQTLRDIHTAFGIHFEYICDCFVCGSARIYREPTIRTLQNHLEYISFTFTAWPMQLLSAGVALPLWSLLLLAVALRGEFSLAVFCILRIAACAMNVRMCMCYIAKAIRIFCNLRACLSLNHFPHTPKV